MPYKRVRKVYRKKKGYQKRQAKVENLSKQITQIKKRQELKYKDGYAASTSVTSTSTAYFTMVMQKGTGVSDRVGDAIVPTSIHWKGQLKTNALNSSTVQIRCIMFWDGQPNGGLPTLYGAVASAAPLLDTTTITDPTFAPICLQGRRRYKVLYDKVYTMTPNLINAEQITSNLSATADVAAASTNVVSRMVNIRRKLGRIIKFGANAGTYADVISNSLWIYFISDQAANAPTVEFSGRLYYKDV